MIKCFDTFIPRIMFSPCDFLGVPTRFQRWVLCSGWLAVLLSWCSILVRLSIGLYAYMLGMITSAAVWTLDILLCALYICISPLFAASACRGCFAWRLVQFSPLMPLALPGQLICSQFALPWVVFPMIAFAIIIFVPFPHCLWFWSANPFGCPTI